MIALGCDHGGYELKQEIKKYLEDKGIEVIDVMEAFTQGLDGIEAVDTSMVIKYRLSDICKEGCTCNS